MGAPRQHFPLNSDPDRGCSEASGLWECPRRPAAIAYTLIETARLNDVDPQAWLAQVLERIPDRKINRIGELVPWNTASTEGREADT